MFLQSCLFSALCANSITFLRALSVFTVFLGVVLRFSYIPITTRFSRGFPPCLFSSSALILIDCRAFPEERPGVGTVEGSSPFEPLDGVSGRFGTASETAAGVMPFSLVLRRENQKRITTMKDKFSLRFWRVSAGMSWVPGDIKAHGLLLARDGHASHLRYNFRVQFVVRWISTFGWRERNKTQKMFLKHRQTTCICLITSWAEYLPMKIFANAKHLILLLVLTINKLSSTELSNLDSAASDNPITPQSRTKLRPRWWPTRQS